MYFLKYKYAYALLLLFILVLLCSISIVLQRYTQKNIVIKSIYGGSSKTAHNKVHKTNKTEKVDKAHKADNAEKVDKADKADKTDKTDKVDKAEKTENKIITIDSIKCISNELLNDIKNIIKRRCETNLNFNILNEDDIKFYERQSCILAEKYNINSDTN
jgi:hypothetical protein